MTEHNFVISRFTINTTILYACIILSIHYNMNIIIHFLYQHVYIYKYFE